MKILKIPKQNLDLFVSVLPAFGEVYAPVRRGSGYAFDRPAALVRRASCTYPRTILPPRKLFLPPREATFTLRSAGRVSRSAGRGGEAGACCSASTRTTSTA